MQVRYEKDNKERIPFEHYLEEFAAIDPKEAAARVGVPWHEETQEFEVRMMQKAFLVKWPECTIRKANPLMKDMEPWRMAFRQRSWQSDF